VEKVKVRIATRFLGGIIEQSKTVAHKMRERIGHLKSRPNRCPRLAVVAVEEISQTTLQKYLCTSNLPDPELMIRTSGEYRISNFLLYQLAYAELYFTDVRWPEFRKKNLYEAILDYQGRERRFGKTSEQVTNKAEGVR